MLKLNSSILQINKFNKQQQSHLRHYPSMRTQSTSKLTTTMLTQLEQNQYLRVKLIQLQKVSREKDDFYLSIFRQQEKVTERVLAEMFLAEDRIKQLIRQRICNNWEEEYDILAESISSYVKDVNSLVQEYQKTKEKLQEKAYNNNDLYQYYSNTLQECGKKFDQAQTIIEELNSKINDLQETVIQLDQTLQDKISIIQEQNQEIQALRYELGNNTQAQKFRLAHQSSTKVIQDLKKASKKLQKDNEASQRSIKEMQKIIQQQRKQYQNEKARSNRFQEELKMSQSENQNLITLVQQQNELIRQHRQNLTIMEKQHNQIEELTKRISHLTSELEARSKEQPKLTHKQSSSNLRKSNTELTSPHNQKNNSTANEDQKPQIFNFQLNQLHLKKILEQQQIIKAIQSQLNNSKNTAHYLESQNQKMYQIQAQFISNENIYRKQIEGLNNKMFQTEMKLKQKQEEIHALKIQDQKCRQQVKDWKSEVEGLYEQMANLQRQISLKKKQNLTRENKVNQLQKLVSDLRNRLAVIESQNSTLQNKKKSFQSDKIEFENQNSILEERVRLLQKDKKQNKHNFQSLLQEFHEFVKETEMQKIRQYEQKQLSLSLSSFEIHETLIIKNKLMSSQENAKMKKKKLSIDLQEPQQSRDKVSLKDDDFQQTKTSNVTGRTKKFNLQSFQQISNPYLSKCYSPSPKVGDIFSSMQHGGKNPSYRW